MRHILDQLLKETRDEIWFNKISQFFGKYISEVGLFGISVSFNPPLKISSLRLLRAKK